MRTALRNYWHILCLTWWKRRSIPPAQRRGIGFSLAFTLLYPFILFFNGACLLLDRLLFPGFRRAEIKAPVFIIGNPRSGTTALHRLMAHDPRTFYFRSWELLAPAIVQKRLLRCLGRVDDLLGRPMTRLLNWRTARKIGDFNRIHKIGLFLPEEDDKLLMHILAASDAAFFFPYAGFENYALFDENVPADEGKRIMRFYLDGVRRQATLYPGKRRLLSKNPTFTGKIVSLQETFGDAKFILLVRNPLEAIPSAINLVRELVMGMFGHPPGDDLDEQLYDIMKHYYLSSPAKLEGLPPQQCITVNYHKLTADPRQTLVEIYSQLDLELTPQVRQGMEAELTRMEQYQSRHTYSLDGCAISRERILTDLAPVFTEHGFDTEVAGFPRNSDDSGLMSESLANPAT